MCTFCRSIFAQFFTASKKFVFASSGCASNFYQLLHRSQTKTCTLGIPFGNHEEHPFRAPPGQETMHQRKNKRTASTRRDLEKGGKLEIGRTSAQLQTLSNEEQAPLQTKKTQKMIICSTKHWHFLSKFDKPECCSITKKKCGWKENKSKKARKRCRITFEEAYIWKLTIT